MRAPHHNDAFTMTAQDWDDAQAVHLRGPCLLACDLAAAVSFFAGENTGFLTGQALCVASGTVA